MRISSLLLAIALLGAPAAVAAGDVAGKVYDAQGRPAADIAVALSGQDRVAITADDGTYRFADVAEGEQQLTITLANAAVQRVWLDVGDAGESRRNIFLLSPAALSSALGIAPQPDMAEDAFARSLELAEQISRDNAQRESAEWRWRDLDA